MFTKPFTLQSVFFMLTLCIHFTLCITWRQLYSHAICVRACARDTSEVIWQYMTVNLQRLVSVHMCVMFVAFNILCARS